MGFCALFIADEKNEYQQGKEDVPEVSEEPGVSDGPEASKVPKG
jgi:hypothetical protein